VRDLHATDNDTVNVSSTDLASRDRLRGYRQISAMCFLWRYDRECKVEFKFVNIRRGSDDRLTNAQHCETIDVGSAIVSHQHLDVRLDALAHLSGLEVTAESMSFRSFKARIPIRRGQSAEWGAGQHRLQVCHYGIPSRLKSVRSYGREIT
jgi:hypothetical protein